MSNGVIKLKQGEFLFKEGQDSDACYVVKSGKIGITKDKGSSVIELAQLGPGQMFGEMAFFDNKPRSAGARAATPEVTVIALPFQALNAQFKNFPEWLKAMVKTVNDHLRDANKKIKTLEKVEGDETFMFDEYLTIRLTAILALVGNKYGEKNDEGHVVVHGETMRRYTIQVFQQPTYKMQKMMETLSTMGILTVEDIGEGQTQITIQKLQMLSEFVDYYTKWVFSAQEKRLDIKDIDIPLFRALVFYGQKAEKDEKGFVKINLTTIQNESMKDLGHVIQVPEWDAMVERKIISDKIQEDSGVWTSVEVERIEKLLPFWELVFTVQKIPARK